MKLSVIIVNYKTPELTRRCIESIFAVHREGVEVIVVDNHSQDNSKALVTSLFPEVVWIDNPENDGFGRANNFGASQAKGEYLLLLNSDMLLLEDTVGKCLSYMESHPETGALGCKLLNEDGSFQKSAYHYVGDYMGVLKNNLIVDYIFKPVPGKIKAVMGAFMLIPKKVFDEVKGFDPDFFMYAEELDLCRRIEAKGYKIVYFEEATAIHKHGGSSEGSDWSHRQNWLSNALLYLKVRGYGGYVLYHFLYFFTFITNLLLLWKMDQPYRKGFWNEKRWYFSNFWLYFSIPFLFKKSFGNGKRILRRT